MDEFLLRLFSRHSRKGAITQLRGSLGRAPESKTGGRGSDSRLWDTFLFFV